MFLRKKKNIQILIVGAFVVDLDKLTVVKDIQQLKIECEGCEESVPDTKVKANRI